MHYYGRYNGRKDAKSSVQPTFNYHQGNEEPVNIDIQHRFRDTNSSVRYDSQLDG